MQKISPYLWFDNQAEEAASFYVSVFRDSRIVDVQRFGDAVMVVTFSLAGQQFYALNGGPQHFSFTEAMSLYVTCKDQAEVDDLWNKLTADGGSPGQCGWLKDKYGVSWQIIPEELPSLLADPDPVEANRVMTAMLGMQKIDIEALRQAAIVEGA
jgi:predicted 3-demethylubiquinone-9 3-methyltransferase (glyoxalase superfamily)